MARIEIEEPQPASVVATHTLLRVVLGASVLLEVARRALHYGSWQQRIAQLGIGDASVDAPLLARSLLVLASLVGAGLVLGLFTRLCTLCVAAAAVAFAAQLPVQLDTLFDPRFELACMVVASATYLFALGGGMFSLDTARRRRARRRAIERDPIWNRAPYSLPPDPSRTR
jgi:uncharacterized membrane protein YphA (DoxX/SURF4 family)